MDDVGRAGFHGRGRECAGFGAATGSAGRPTLPRPTSGVPMRRCRRMPRCGATGPTLLPPQEVYTVVRDSGFSPLGIPQLRGLVYTISVIDRGGDDGRLVIDARTGRIIRFMPAYRMGDNSERGFDGHLWSGRPAADRARSEARRGRRLDPACRQPHALAGAARRARVPQQPRASQPTEQSAAVQPKPADAQPVAAGARLPPLVRPSPPRRRSCRRRKCRRCRGWIETVSFRRRRDHPGTRRRWVRDSSTTKNAPVSRGVFVFRV